MSYVNGSIEFHGTVSKLLHPETNESLLYASCTYHPGQKTDWAFYSKFQPGLHPEFHWHCGSHPADFNILQCQSEVCYNELLRNSKWILMWNNFSWGLALVKLLCSLFFLILQVFTPLYRYVKDTMLNVNTSKRVVWSLIKSPMICCLILLLSYKGTISNPLHV